MSISSVSVRIRPVIANPGTEESSWLHNSSNVRPLSSAELAVSTASTNLSRLREPQPERRAANRAVSMSNPALVKSLDELIPCGEWRKKLEEAERRGATSDERKMILVDAFGESLAKIGGYNYVAETTVLKPVSDRPFLYSFATRRVTPQASKSFVIASFGPCTNKLRPERRPK